MRRHTGAAGRRGRAAAADGGVDSRCGIDGGGGVTVRRIAVRRDGALMALALDGSGARPLVMGPAHRAGFTPDGTLVYELLVNTDDPPDDTPVFEYSSFAMTPSGDTVSLRRDDSSCDVSLVAPSGRYVAYRCAEGPLHRIDGSHVLDTGASYPLGFDRDERGLVVADYASGELRYVTMDGDTRVLASFFSSPPSIHGPPFDYAP